MDKKNLVILVDEQDAPIGVMEKMVAHEQGLLHRAFSVLVFNDQQEMLIHRRALGKYHSGGLWTNACCSHPMPDEAALEAAHRRLQEEMGFDCPVSKVFSFRYRATLDQGLTEHEYDHVFFGHFNGTPNPNPEEVMDWRFISLPTLNKAIIQHPDDFTEWFKIIMERIDTSLVQEYLGTVANP